MQQDSAGTTFPPELFRFSGQSRLDVWTLRGFFQLHGRPAYEHFLSHEPELCFQRIRDLVDAFPTHQRRAPTGRPPSNERDILIAMLVRQFMNATFDQLESYLRVLQAFFDIQHVPDSKTLSEKNRTRRFRRLLERFHVFVLSLLPKRNSVVCTDATGYSNEKLPWSRADYRLRATQDWIKVHAAIEVPTLLYLNTVNTRGRVHESRMFGPVWTHLPDNVRPVRSLADAAYAGTACLEAARAHGATPLHGLRKNASRTRLGRTPYTDLVKWARQWPNRFAALTGRRALVETAFNCTKQRFGFQLRCRDPTARRNEILAKQVGHNLRMLVARETMITKGVFS